MKKKTKANKNQKNKSPNIKFDRPDKSRRSLLRTLRNYAIGLSIVGAAGGVWAYNIQGAIHEMDLTRVGQGVPSVVQIHDPNCPICQALQRETRSALAELDEGALEYVVANIKAADGAAFAARYGVPHVTLLLFDKRGRLQNILSGSQVKDDLVKAFEELAEAS